MAINIRELFNSDSEGIRLEKINYNFDQIVANGGGPIGLQGSKGAVGPQGSKGNIGATGAQGAKGDAGVATDYFYKKEHSLSFNNNILTPLADSDHLMPPSMVLGVWTDGTDVSQVPDYDSSPVLIKFDDGVHTSAFRVFIDDPDSGFDFQFVDNTITSTATFKVSGLSSPVDYVFEGNSLVVKVGGINKVILGTDSTFNNNAIFNAGVKIPTGSGVGKFLKSDAAGNAAWAYANPLGTIVMVSKFVLDNYVNWAGNSGPFASEDWKGRGTGIWEGWYFCWGQTWGSYSTPDLRERYPMGYAGTSGTLLSGASDEAKNAAQGMANHSTSGVGGYYGTNDIDQLQAKQTASAHTHNVTVTPVPRTEPDIIGVDATYAANTSVTTTSTSNGATTTDITPRSAVVGYMIYLGSPNLTYSLLLPPTP